MPYNYANKEITQTGSQNSNSGIYTRTLFGQSIHENPVPVWTAAYSHFLRTAGPHFPDSPGHIKRTAWDISRAEGSPPY